jgi:hypothetical protein
MADMDIGVLFLEDGKVKKLGDYISSSYGVPDEDKHNDWKLESSKKSGDKATIKFSRAVKTDDTKNVTICNIANIFYFRTVQWRTVFCFNSAQTWANTKMTS